jgi:hypothetical protein
MANERKVDWVLWVIALAAACYTLASGWYLFQFYSRFREMPWSTSPEDWTNFAGMMGALVGTPLGFLSLVYVIWTVRLQQQQIQSQFAQRKEQLERENRLLDPVIKACRVRPKHELPNALRSVPQGQQYFELRFEGSVDWTHSDGPDKTSVAILRPTESSGIAIVSLWSQSDGRYAGKLHYERRNGSSGSLTIWVSDREESMSVQFH